MPSNMCSRMACGTQKDLFSLPLSSAATNTGFYAKEECEKGKGLSQRLMQITQMPLNLTFFTKDSHYETNVCNFVCATFWPTLVSLLIVLYSTVHFSVPCLAP